MTFTSSFSQLDIDNATELEDFLDSYIPNQLSQYNVAGMTLSFVKDDELLLTKGYGDRMTIPTVRPIIANQTLFRIGSVSKTFTAVAVLQLVDDGILNLDIDINNYLTAFQIPDTYNDPITLRHLLTHTAGFEEKAYPSILSSPIGVPSLEDMVIEILPDRVHPPGTITSYSNYGFTLAGYIVEEMSGKSFEQYIEDEIFLPIGMNSSTFKQPLPTSEMSSNMSMGYYQAGSQGFFEYITVAPAGSCSSTATDMAKFMIALLDNGYYNDTQILLNETAQMMQEEHFTTHTNLPGVNLGLYEMDTHDTHIIGHGGDTIFFHSLMALFPEDDLGFFVSYNSQSGSVARDEFFEDIIDQFYPHTIEVTPMINYGKNLRQFTGLYLTTRRYYSDKIITPLTSGFTQYEIIERDYLDEAWRITKSRDGYLQLLGLEFIQVEPDYFVESTGQYDYTIGFVRNKRGHITNFYTTIIIPCYSYELVHPIYSSPDGINFILFIISVLFLVVSILWGILGIIRSRRNKEEKVAKFPIISKWFTIGVLIFSIIPFTLVISKNYSTILLAQDAFDGLNGLIVLPIIAILLIVGMIASSVLSWFGIGNTNNKPYWKLWERILYAIVTSLSSIFIAFFMLWNLLGY
ncbi:MAG: beta-lactamase family protein [Asgard group archaeon]|nr:beta-lactamase family protein [Asgard group archaeon]